MDEQTKVLRLVAENKITPIEASRLIEAMLTKKTKAKQARQLVVNVWREDEEKPAMVLRVPIKLIQLGARFIPMKAKAGLTVGSNHFDFSALNWEEIFEIAARGEIDDILSLDLADDRGNPLSIRIFAE